MKNKRLSIVDIANGLQISKTTVSFIINGKAKEKRISTELVERVNKYIQVTGYKPSSVARNLRTGRSKIIGFLVEDISNHFFSKIAHLIEDKAYENGYRLIYASTNNDDNRSKDLISMMRDCQVDGYIITPTNGIEEEVKALTDAGFPVVLFDRTLPGADIDCVMVDNQDGTYNAVVHLIRSGCRNVAFVTFESAQNHLLEREHGYSDAVEEYGLAPQIIRLPYTHDEALISQTLNDLIVDRDDLDAVFFATSRIGTCWLTIVKSQTGIKPAVVVASFDDDPAYLLHSPAITVIAQPVEDIAQQVMSIMISQLKKSISDPEKKKITLKTKLIIRESTGFRPVL